MTEFIFKLPSQSEVSKDPAAMGAFATMLLEKIGAYILLSEIEEVGSGMRTPVWAGSEMIGTITYTEQDDGTVHAIVTDVPNSLGNILTTSAAEWNETVL